MAAGELREHRPFWPAVLFAMGLFVAVHLLLFLTLPWALALAAVGAGRRHNAASGVPPRTGRAEHLASALVHFVMQGAIKVIVVSRETGAGLPLIWMVGCAKLPYWCF